MSDVPQRWWQWMLMYPTLAVALIGAVPQYSSWVTAAAKGLPVLGDAKYARQESDKAWDRNLDCLTNIEHIKPNANTKYGIDLVPCPSGDILVTLTPLQSPGTHISRWIVTTDFFSDIAQFSLVGTATAQESSTGSSNPVRIIGIKKSGSVVTKRVQFPDNSCADQTIDSYTGRQVNQQKASCSPF
jgi:hypothetical protein